MGMVFCWGIHEHGACFPCVLTVLHSSELLAKTFNLRTFPSLISPQGTMQSLLAFLHECVRKLFVELTPGWMDLALSSNLSQLTWRNKWSSPMSLENLPSRFEQFSFQTRGVLASVSCYILQSRAQRPLSPFSRWQVPGRWLNRVVCLHTRFLLQKKVCFLFYF